MNFALCDTKLNIRKKIVKHLLGYSNFSSKHFLFQAIGLNLFFLKTLKKDLTQASLHFPSQIRLAIS